MAKLKIYTFPDAVLATRATPIDRVEKSYFQLADDMLETMYDAPGIGLAANQVGILQRIVVVDTDYDSDDSLEDAPTMDQIILKKNPIVLINPEIIYREGKNSTQEGCLSVPDFLSEVPRADKIKVQYLDLDGLTQTLSADGIRAICIQHELDHLDGKLFIDRLSPLKREFAKKKLIRARKQSEE